MLKSRHIDRICIAVILVALVITTAFMFGEFLGIRKSTDEPEYQKRIFDDGYVHEIDLKVDDWEGFLENAPQEEYISCDIVIDGEQFNNVGVRVKGNNSRSLVEEYGLSRYSFKVEFDHYTDGGSYYGLDKLNLDASFQDNSYLKNYMAYDMMRHMEVPAPLCSYAWIKVNGYDWGLYLALEEPEEAFAKRSFGKNHGKLYKPDYKDVYAPNNDVALKYTGDDPENYDNIFRKAKFKTSAEDEKRLIESLKVLSENEEPEKAVNVDEVMRYFTVQSFVINLDSYLGPTGHNYFLYEEDGVLSMLPWDYNLAFCTYSLGMPEPVNDAGLYVNFPIDTPADGEVMTNRPMFHNLMLHEEYYKLYHSLYDDFIETYFENGYFDMKTAEISKMISPYVEVDPTAYCSYEDYLTGVRTFRDFCTARAISVRKQLDGEIPSSINGQSRDKSGFVDASHIWLPDMGEIDDLRD